ncbi:integrase [Klebsiella pneumoniae]|nr:integrase [Klebsiella pneumoniae]
MNQSGKSAHLAWCALVALALARQNGDVVSPAQENLFLTRWLATALRQRRFSRDVASDIEWLLKQGRQLGVNAQLGVVSENGIYGHSRFCNTDFDDKLACLNLSGV